MKLENRVAIIVGGGNGIGERTSKLFAEEGAKVIVADINIEAANRVADGIGAKGHEAAAFKVDHTKEEEAAKMVKFALDKFGQIDIMANIAGTHGYIEGGEFIRKDEGPFAESTKALWDSTIDINLNGARNCTRAVIGHMMERHKGKIVNFSSIAAVNGAPGMAAYAAAKGGIISLTKTLAREMAPYGILVNCIIPSQTASEQVLERMARNRKANPGRPAPDMSRFADPMELAHVVLWLVADDVTHMSGQCISVGLS
jgi:NAD(P)-dependent dehydrogenase (short-subunit alcohol dehydrogenase family)